MLEDIPQSRCISLHNSVCMGQGGFTRFGWAAYLLATLRAICFATPAASGALRQPSMAGEQYIGQQIIVFEPS